MEIGERFCYPKQNIPDPRVRTCRKNKLHSKVFFPANVSNCLSKIENDEGPDEMHGRVWIGLAKYMGTWSYIILLWFLTFGQF
jgi:hypothetical protein